MSEIKKQEKISEDIINIVIARLETLPSNVEISVGGEDSLSVEELIERVKSQDKIGIQMVEMQLAFIRSLGKLPSPEILNVNTHN